MLRRQFLKLIGGSAIAAALPLTVISGDYTPQWIGDFFPGTKSIEEAQRIAKQLLHNQFIRTELYRITMPNGDVHIFSSNSQFKTPRGSDNTQNA